MRTIGIFTKFKNNPVTFCIILLLAVTASDQLKAAQASHADAAVPEVNEQNEREEADSPYLSNLRVKPNDPLFATYAAPIRRSEYIVDEGYRFKFYEDSSAIRFDTDHAGSWGLALRKNGAYRYKLEDMHKKPVVTTSYSDLVKYAYQPYENVQVNVFFQVYSSHLAVRSIQITNRSEEGMTLDVTPYLDMPETAGDIEKERQNIFTFTHRQEPDGWTERKHDVPHQTERVNIFTIQQRADRSGGFADLETFHRQMQSAAPFGKKVRKEPGVLAFNRRVELEPGQSTRLRVVRGVRSVHDPMEKLKADARELMEYDMNQAIRFNENLYESIPKLEFDDRDTKLMYWNAFNLIRQCMLPAEAKTSYNHYVYSREPTWGWGHAGQVFHESLSMLAYVFMDPESAEDSQRLYMERQWENGYIEYRAGPYLDAMNYVNGEFTSSAPWFNYENWEIFKVSRDTSFLEEAYESGTSFYQWWLDHRDKDGDGLAEWGGHAILESVRDAQVAVWKEVGWPSNFEAPELNAMMVKEAEALAHMAGVLGLQNEQKRWEKEAQTRSQRIQETFWHEPTNFFYYVDKEDNDFTFEEENDLLRQSIVGFIPLWAGTASEQQVEALVETLTDSDKFWRPYGVPSLAADDSFYKPTGYWNGPVWVEWQYLIVNGLLEHGYEKEAAELSDRVFENVIHHLKDSHTFWEFYSPDDTWAGHHQTYIWTGIVARMLLELDGKALN